MFDESKKIKTRFIKSKDFDKTCEKLKKQGYEVIKGIETNDDTKQTNKIIMIVKNGNVLVSVHYNDRNDFSDYKQEIICIIY